MYPFLSGAYAALRRKLSEDQDRPLRNRIPMWRLLADEVVILLRRFVTTPRWWVPTLVAILVFMGLMPFTPGPTVSVGWRLLAAVVVGGLAAALIRLAAGASRRSGGSLLLDVELVNLSDAWRGLVLVTLVAVGFALAGWLLAALVSYLF